MSKQRRYQIERTNAEGESQWLSEVGHTIRWVHKDNVHGWCATRFTACRAAGWLVHFHNDKEGDGWTYLLRPDSCLS